MPLRLDDLVSIQEEEKNILGAFLKALSLEAAVVRVTGFTQQNDGPSLVISDG